MVKRHTGDMRNYESMGALLHFMISGTFSNISRMLPESFHNLDIFSGMNANSIDCIIPLLEACSFSGKETIYEQNQEANYFYILVSGEVVVKHKPYDGDAITIARVCIEDVIGWSAALGRPRYSSSAFAEVPCELVRIDVAAMRDFCHKNPQLGKSLLEKFAQGIAYRLKSTYDEVLALLFHGMELVPEK